jgi:hypothetical protein
MPILWDKNYRQLNDRIRSFTVLSWYRKKNIEMRGPLQSHSIPSFLYTFKETWEEMERGSAAVHLLFSDLGHNSIIVSTRKIVFARMVVTEGTKATWKLVHFSS